MEQRKNDWLATLFFSPDKSIQDLANLGINTDNSSLQDEDYYKKIPQIQEAFKKENGEFDDSKFNVYYQDVLKQYNEADKTKLKQDLTDFYSYDPEDYFAPVSSKQRDVVPSLIRIKNPERRSRGMNNLFETSAPTMSFREVAQQNKIYNVETGKFEDWTPNDWGGLSAISRPTLVLAQYDEDGTHEIDGRIVSHKKGDLKFNEKGDPYYETLGDRDISGKDLLHISDTLTVDGSKWNKYDFFDADGLTKSVTGTVAKTVFKLAPMFLPVIGKFYGGLTATIELGKVLPILYKSIEGIATGDISTSKSAQTATDIQAYFSRFDDSVSDYGRQSFWNVENLGKMIGDSSMQLFQQRFISEIPLNLTKIFKNGNVSENTLKWGAKLAQTYMAVTSSTEAYDAFKEAGASDDVAGLGMLATVGAMYSLMNNDYFRDFWFRGSYLDRANVKSVVKDAAKQLRDKNLTFQTNSPKEAANWILKTKSVLFDKFSKMKPGDLFYDALNEGIEETIEEGASDFNKGIFSALNSLGIIDSDKEYDFGISPEDMASRYFTSFVGGGIGGAVFSLHNRFENRHNKTNDQAIEEGGDTFKELIFLLRGGKKSDIEKELSRLHDAGKLASTNLSGTEIKMVKNGDTFSPEYQFAKNGESQNDLLYKQIGYYIDRIDELLKEEGLNISDSELQILSEQAENLGVSEELMKQMYLKHKEDSLQRNIIKAGIHNQLFEDWNDLTSEIVKTKVKLEQMLTPNEDEAKRDIDIEAKIKAMKSNNEYNTLKDKLDELRKQKEEILNGEKNDYYTGQLLFAANRELVDGFVSGFGIHNYTKYKYDKDYDSLNEDEKKKIDEEYKEYSSSDEKHKVLTAFDIFTQMQELTGKTISEVSQKIKDSSELFFSGTTENSFVTEYYQNQIEENNQKIEELSTNPEENKDEIDELTLKNSQLQNTIENINKFKFGFVSPALSNKGNNILFRPNQQTGDDFLIAYNNYFDSYLDYLQYIKNKGLYLDKIDGDFARILEGWLTINNLIDIDNNNISDKLFNISKLVFNTPFDENDPFLPELIKKIQNVLNAVKSKNLNQIIDKYNELLMSSEIEDGLVALDINLSDLLKEFFPKFNNTYFIDYLQNVKLLKSEINTSPIYELLNVASKITNLDNDELVNLIQTEKENFLNAKSVEDFLIKDQRSVIKLKETIKLAKALEAILDAAKEGEYNEKINVYRQALNKELLPILNSQDILNIKLDLNQIVTQLEALVEISDKNRAQKLREQKDITTNMRIKFWQILTAKDKDSLIKEKFKTLFDIDLESITPNIPEFKINENKYEISDEDYQKLVEASIELETKIFQTINNSKLSNLEIAKRLVSLFNEKELISGKPTKLNKNADTIITDYDQLIYLTTIIGAPSQNFYSKLKSIISKEDFKNAPIFSQEYAVRIGYSKILNPDLFNNVINELSKIAKNSEDKYIQSKSPLTNVMSICGGAGVGKTKGVAYLLKKIFDEAGYITSAPSEKQTERLSESVEHNGLHLTKNELITKIIGGPIKDSDIIDLDGVSVTINPKLEVKTDDLFGDVPQKILFIDEIGWYNRIELEIISKWAKKNGVSVISFGDLKQNTAFIMYNNIRVDCGMEDTFICKSPDLIAPLRPDNIAKIDNYNSLSERLDNVYDVYYKDPSVDITILDNATKNVLSKKPIQFKYFETQDLFGGSKIIKESEVFDSIDKLKTKGSLAVITDNPEKYQTVQGIKIVPLNEIQGDEYDYVVIDKHFRLDDNKNNKGNFLILKDIYTLTQRSKKGSLIVDQDLPNYYSDKLDVTSSGNIELSPNQIEGFKTWYINSLNNILDSELNWTPSVETETETDSTNVSEIDSSKKDEIKPNSSTSSNLSTKSQTSLKSETNNENGGDSDLPPLESYKDPTEEFTKPEESNTITKNKEVIIETTTEDYPKTKEPFIVTPTTKKDIISSAVDFYSFMQTEQLKEYFKSSTTKYGIDKYFETKKGPRELNLNPIQLRKALNILRSYFVYGHYKNNNKKVVALNLAQKINTNLRLWFDPLLNNSFRFIITDYDGKRLLVSRIEPEKGEYVDIPLLLIKENCPLGEYQGEIEIASMFIKTKGPARSNLPTIDLANFETGLNETNQFTTYPYPVVLSANKDDENLFNQAQRDWIYGSNGKYGKNGNTFMLISADPFIEERDFKDFLDPSYNDDGKIEYTIKNIPQVTLAGINWTITFRELTEFLVKANNIKNSQSVINSNRAGQINAILYQHPELKEEVKKGIRMFLNPKSKNYKENRRIKINKTVVATIEEADALLSSGETIYSIVPGNIYNNKFSTWLIGEYIINTLIGKHRFSSKQINEIESLCRSSETFKQGIYARDLISEQIGNGFYWTTQNLNNTYISNYNAFYGNNFKIDTTKIRLTKDEQKRNLDVDRVNKQLKELGFNRIVTDLNSIPYIIESINSEILSKVTEIEYSLLEWDGNNINWVKYTSVIPLISNQLGVKINKENLYFVNSSNSLDKTFKFQPFLVSLQNSTVSYVLEHKNNEWTARTFAKDLFEAYQKILTLGNDLELNKNEAISKYISKLLDNEEIDRNTAVNFWKERTKTEYSNVDWSLIDNYLVLKLINNEC